MFPCGIQAATKQMSGGIFARMKVGRQKRPQSRIPWGECYRA